MPAAPSAIARRKVIDHLLAADAVSANAAIPFEPEHMIQRHALERLRERGVVRVVADGRYYLDVSAYHAFRAELRRRILFAIGIGLLIVVGIALLGGAVGFLA